MKRSLTIIITGWLFTFYANAQQRTNKFQVIDSKSKLAIPAVSMIILRAGIAITTEEDGVFIIPGNLAVMNDTVMLNAQNYMQRKLPLKKLNGMDTVQLNKLKFAASNAPLKYKADTLLNNYNVDDIGYWAGTHSPTSLFNYLQMAQQFYLPKVGFRLKQVTIHREVFDYNRPIGTSFTLDVLPVKFRLRVYDIDPKTNGPGADICNEIIEVTNIKGIRFDISLKNYNIVIPGKTFFIAVEWMRDFYNQNRTALYNKTTGKSDILNSYRPIIGISPITGKKINIWGMNFRREWKPYNYFYPFGTDLAIKAMVEY
jgi:hypothetical protein